MTEAKKQKSLRRGEIREQIIDNGLVGRIINVFGTNPKRITGRFTFYQNMHNKRNTGYYIEETQIPLLSIREVGGDYLIV